ncbi:MAG: hypothetical protein J5737_04235 [Bacteroidales bacterium]|nr:hypothetical protein [Bacteroidales bacterium]
MKLKLLVLALILVPACTHDAYDLSRGIDKEVTLFTDQVSLPLGDVGPLTPKSLLDKSGLGDMLKDFVNEDEDGYLVIEKEEPVYSNHVMLIAFFLPDQSVPVDFPADAWSGNLGTTASSVSSLGLSLARQEFTVKAKNPLTEEIAVSGKLTVSSQPDGDDPAETLICREFSRVKVDAGADGEILSEERSSGKPFFGCRVENIFLHLPASMLEKDPLGGLGAFVLSYHYKSYLALASDFPESLPFDISDLDIPLARYRVKEARICTEVSSEIPVTLVVDNVQVLVKQTDDDGNESIVPSEDISVTPGITIQSGCTGTPAVSPLEIEIKAQEGTIPDISGLRLSFSIKAPTGSGDHRLGMNQTISFNNLRATVSGGITIQGL